MNQGEIVAELLETAEQAARIGGRVLQEWADKFTPREKSPANLVTEADFASEKAIFNFIHERFPDHRFLGEEGLHQDDGCSPYRWLIDPLDGTSNYVHGFPYYAVSIGVEQDGALVAGAIYDPSRDEMFSAAIGKGATVDGRPLQVSQRDDLASALCMASLPVKTTRDDPAVQSFLRVLEAAQHVQRTGSAALNLASVAAGRVEAFWSTSLKPWDMAAGVLLVQESGGRVTQTSGGPFSVDVPDLLASNGTPLPDVLVSLLGHGSV